MRKVWLVLGLLGLAGVGCVSDVGGDPRPVAVVGADGTVAMGTALALDGSGSFVPGNASAILSYGWSVAVAPAEGTAELSSTSEASPTLTGSAPGLYVVRLVVSRDDQSSLPAYANVRVFEQELPPASNAGPDQTVDPGSTVTLDGTGSMDPNGGTLGYAWSQTTGGPVALSDPTAASPTFTAPLPAGTLSFSLTVTDAGGLTSQPDTVAVTVRDLPPVADILAPATGDEGGAVALDGTGSSDPNGDPGTAFTYAWTAQSNLGVTLTDPTIARPAFTVPSFCGTESVVVGLTVTVGGQSSAPATATIDLQDLQNDAPVADAGVLQFVGEGDTVTLDGSGTADCNGDTLSYTWAQTAGPAVSLSDTAAASPTFTAPSVLTDTPLDFLLNVADPGGLTASATVTVTVQNSINEPPVAVAGPPQSVQVQAAVTLDGSGSSDPNGDALSYAWVQTGGSGVSLTDATAMQPTFTAPSAPGTLDFELTVNDGMDPSTPATVTITVTPAGPDLGASTIVAADASLLADGSATTGVTVSVVDGVGNPLPGQTIVINTSAGTLLGGVNAVGDGTYTQSLRAPTSTGVATLGFTIGGQAASQTTTVAFLPGDPVGTITLFAAPSAIPADGTSTSTITSDTIVDSNGNAVADGTLVTVSTDLGTLTTADADGVTPGLQVATSGGVISFVLQSTVGVGTANLQANTVTGTATGGTTVPFQTGLPEGTINVVAASPTRIADGSSTTQVTGGPVTDASGNPVPDGTLITVSIDPSGVGGTILDADEDAAPGIQVSTSGGTFVITVQAGTEAGTMIVNADSAQGSASGSTTVTLIPGPAAGTIILGASPDPIAVSGTTSSLPTSTTVTSGVITDANGNPVPDGTMVTVSADLGSSITTLDADVGAAGIQVATVGGVISFEVDSGTAAGTLTASASVASASGSTSVTVTPGPAAQLIYVSGNAQTGTVGTALLADLVVRVEDANTNAVAGEMVGFSATAGGGSVLPISVATDAAGEAHAVATLGTVSGTSNNAYQATATLTGSPIAFTASAEAGPAVSFDVTGHPGSSTAGVSQSVTVTARDVYGNVATGYTGTVLFSSSDGAANLPGSTTFTGGDAGVVTVSVELRTAGTQSVTATDSSSGSITGSQSGISVSAAAASDLIYVSGDAQSGVISQDLTQPLMVRAEDPFGNPVSGESVTFAATAGGGSVSPVSPTTDAAGEAQTTATLGSTAGSDNNTFTATAALAGSPITFTASATAGAATTLVYVSGTPQTGTVGAALPAEFVVRVEDAGGNPVAGTTVSFAETSGGGSVLPTSIASDAAGEARATGTLGITAGTSNNTFEATAALTGSPIVFTASADPGAAVSFTVTGHPSPSTAGTSQTVTVTALDTYGNLATGYTGTINFTSSDGLAGLPAIYPFVVGDAGVATFSGVVLRTAGTQSITATDMSVGTITGSQTGIQVDPAGADHLGMAVQPSNAVAGVANNPAIQVEVLDAFGNRVTAGSFDVARVFGTDASAGAATLGGTSPVTTAAGVASFSDLTLDIAASGYTLDFSAVGVGTGVTSGTFDITAAAPAQLAFGVQPTGASEGATISPAVTVQILDAFGNLCTTVTDNIVLAIDSDPNGAGGSTLAGTTTVAASGGVATFSDLSITPGGTGFTLEATSGVLTLATSNAFDITGCTISALATATGVGGATTAFPWDTIVLDGTGTTDCGASLTYSWSVAVTATDATADEVGGFAPWATLPATATGIASNYYVQEPGSYVFTLTADDSGTPYTDTATITVVGFAQIPYGGSNPAAADSRALALDPSTGEVYIGLEGGTGGLVYDPGAGTIEVLQCLSSNQSQAIAVSPAGVPHFTHDNSPVVDQITDVAACVANTGGVTVLDPQGVATNNPARTRDILFPDSSEDFYLGTDDDVFFWDDSASGFTEYTYATNGADAEYRAIAIDHDGNFWFASYENANADRTVKTSNPAVETATLDHFTSSNDKARDLVRGLSIPSTLNEMWVCTDALGIAYYDDAATATSGGATVFDVAGGDLLLDEIRHGVLEDDTTDMWFLSINGINRYKRDVGGFASIPMGSFGLPATGGSRELRMMAIDEGTGRGRAFYFSLRADAVYEIAAP